MRRSGITRRGAWVWIVLVVAVNLGVAGWLAWHLAAREHNTGAAVGVMALSVLVLFANYHTAGRPPRPGDPKMVREGHTWVPEHAMRPPTRLSEDLDVPRPKLGAPGSMN